MDGGAPPPRPIPSSAVTNVSGRTAPGFIPHHLELERNGIFHFYLIIANKFSSSRSPQVLLITQSIKNTSMLLCFHRGNLENFCKSLPLGKSFWWCWTSLGLLDKNKKFVSLFLQSRKFVKSYIPSWWRRLTSKPFALQGIVNLPRN